MFACRFLVLTSLALFLGGLPVHAQQPQTCQSVFGPGYTPHPDFSDICCSPGFVPVPGKRTCAKPGQENAAPTAQPQAPAASGQPGDNVYDAEGRPGAPGGHCIPSGATCTLGGAPCCASGETCQGKFPNTVCR